MHALDWLSDPGKQTVRPVYAVYGTDPYLVRESIAAVTRAVFPGSDDDAAVTRYGGNQANLADVRDELFTLPFFSSRRLVIVEEADGFVSKHRKELENYVECPSSSGILVLQVKQWTATTNLAKRVEKLGAAIDCNGCPKNRQQRWRPG